MSTAFDSMFLPGGDFLASQEDFLNLGHFQQNDFSNFGSGMHPNDGTVSPSDLYNTDDPIIMSAPQSTAFPNLSTPDSGYLESPAMASSGLNTSPLEDGLLDSQLDFSQLDSMAPLFPQDDAFDEFAQSCVPAGKRAPLKPVNSAQAGASPMKREKSSPGRPPTIPYSHGRKHSQTYGISKSAKSRKYLPDIVIESEDDKETAKRKKNTAAARKSRQRKQEHAEASEAEIQRLRAMIYRMGGDPDEGR